MPPKNQSMEMRMAEVEQELHRIKQLVAESAPTDEKTPWWKKLVGTQENDPVFAEIVELGRQIRKGKPPAKRKKKKPAASTKAAR